MNKILNYIMAVIGLAILVLSFNLEKFSFIPESIKPAYVLIAGLILIIVGIAFAFQKEKVSQAAEEVPIYQGKKIVGYRKQGK